MKSKEIKFRDPVVERVVDKFVSRSDVGYDKYKRTLDDERTGGHKDLLGYLKDIQEELMDAILYIQTAREEIREQIVSEAINEVDTEGFRPPHPSHASCAQLDWDDAIAPV
jgi:hypothetical protein